MEDFATISDKQEMILNDGLPAILDLINIEINEIVGGKNRCQCMCILYADVLNGKKITKTEGIFETTQQCHNHCSGSYGSKLDRSRCTFIKTKNEL